MKTLKKALFLILAFALPCTAACGIKKTEPAAPAEIVTVTSVEAQEMRLVWVDGDIAMKDEAGTSIPCGEGMRLFNGYQITTITESLAGISLDAAKAATLGNNSSATLHQKDRLLSLDLEEGELYFNVSKPLDNDESFDINTSNMTLGIRGTAGYVAVIDSETTKVILATGHALITGTDGKTQEINGGQEVTVYQTADGTQFKVHAVNPDGYPDLLANRVQEDNIEPETVEEETLPTDGDRIVFTGTLELYSYDEMVALQGEPDPNAAWADTSFSYYILVLDTPQRMTLMAGDGSSPSEGVVRMISIRTDPIVFGHHSFSIDPQNTYWPSDTSMPLRQPRTSDLHVLDE